MILKFLSFRHLEAPAMKPFVIVFTSAIWVLAAGMAAPVYSQGANPLAAARADTTAAGWIAISMRNAALQGQTHRLGALSNDYVNAINRALRNIDIAAGEGRPVGDALAAVGRATQTHGNVLSGLLNSVPAQARPGIARALQASQRGRATALNRLNQIPQNRGRPPAGLGAFGGAPTGFGGRGGPPSGFGISPGRAGAPAIRGGYRGRGRGRR